MTDAPDKKTLMSEILPTPDTRPGDPRERARARLRELRKAGPAPGAPDRS